ncbi:MAG: hypothetical protein HS117_23445 [Verrucomicrobiaceae bacterium]|nr:hypothetical protein [Verrucomicrobiaceae bacterium]
MYSQKQTLKRPHVGETVQTYNCDNSGHYVEVYEVVSISDAQIQLKHLSTRRYSGVTEERGAIIEGGEELIEYLSVPTETQWQKHWRSTLAFSEAMIRGTSMQPWLPLAEELEVPSPP